MDRRDRPQARWRSEPTDRYRIVRGPSRNIPWIEQAQEVRLR